MAKNIANGTEQMGFIGDTRFIERKLQDFQTFKQLREGYRQGMLDLNDIFIQKHFILMAYNKFNSWLSFYSDLTSYEQHKVRDKIKEVFDID